MTPTPDLAAVVAELEKLHAAATPAPWEEDTAFPDTLFGPGNVYVLGSFDTDTEPDEQVTANVRLACLARNALPALLAAARERDELKAVILDGGPQGGHDKPCHDCGEPCSAFAGNPGLWPVYARMIGRGLTGWYHVQCVTKRLKERDSLARELAAVRTQIPDPQLAEWQALADAASPGPWVWGDDNCLHAPETVRPNDYVAVPTYEDGISASPSDRAFIAAARTAVPALLAALAAERETAARRVGELEAEVEKLRRERPPGQYKCGCQAIWSDKVKAFCPVHLQPFPEPGR